MIQVRSIPYNNFQVNTCLIWDETGQCLVVDPAFYTREEQQSFQSLLAEKELTVAGQANTHCHVDHLLGVRFMKSEYGCAFRAHREELQVAASATMMGEIFGWRLEPLDGIDEYLEDNDLLTVGNHSLRIIHVPGHSPGGVAFYSEEGRFVISGDALFKESIGRTDLPGGDYDTLIRSIVEKLLSLPRDTVVYPGHGPATTIGEEVTGNPFLGSV